MCRHKPATRPFFWSRESVQDAMKPLRPGRLFTVLVCASSLLLQFPLETTSLALARGASGDGGFFSADTSDDGTADSISIPIVVVVVLAAVVLVMIAVCLIGWVLAGILLYHCLRHNQTEGECVRCTGFHGAGSPIMQSLGSSQSIASCNNHHQIAPLPPSPQTTATPLITLPYSKSDLSAILASGKQAVTRVSRSNPELTVRFCKKLSHEEIGVVPHYPICETRSVAHGHRSNPTIPTTTPTSQPSGTLSQ